MINSVISSNGTPGSGMLLQAAFAAMTEATSIYEADGRLVEFNDEFIRFHRFRDRDECSRNISECQRFLDVWFADGTPAPPGQWAVPRALRGETSSDIEYRLRHKETGETWWGCFNFAPMKDKQGRVIGAVVTAREITEIKQAEEALRKRLEDPAVRTWPTVEKARAEEALRESELKYRKLFENRKVGLAYCQAMLSPAKEPVDYRFLEVNDVFETMTGLKREAVVGRTAREVMPGIENSAFDFIGVHCGVALNGEETSFETYQERLQRWYSVMAYQTKPGYFVSLFTDITDRKKTEEALREELERAHLLHDVSTALIQADNIEALYDKILDTAVAALHSDFASLQMLETEGEKAGELRLLGYRGFSQYAAKFWECVNPASESACGIALRTKQRVYVPDVRKCDFMDGSLDLACYLETGIVAVQTTPLVSRSGELLGMISTHWRETHEPAEGELRALDVLARQAADLLARKRAEEALRESEKRMQLALQVGRSYTYEWDSISDTVIRSESCAPILGLSGNEGIMDTGTQYFERVHPDDRRRFLEIMKDITPENCSYNLEYRVRRKDGTIVVLSELAEGAFDSDGKLLRLVGIVTDITERRRAEDELRHLNEKLEQRVAERTAELRKKDQLLLIQGRQAAMGEMLGNIAHQWRQPLNNLGLHIQQLSLLHDLGEFSKDVLDETVERSMHLIKHMSRTIDDFRNYFKPDKEKVEFCLSTAVEDSLSLIADSLKSKHIDVQVSTEAEAVIYGYQNEFAQALLNILNNAVDALTDREITNPKITMVVEAQKQRAVLTISDNAGGVPEEVIEKIFDPYFTTKADHKGTGVGLFMSKAIIEQNMGGRLTVRNAAKGAEFKIEV